MKLLLGDDRGLVDAHANTHGAGDGDLLQVHALGCSRLGLLQRVDQGSQVFLQRGFFERSATDGGVDDTGLVGTKSEAKRVLGRQL